MTTRYSFLPLTYLIDRILPLYERATDMEENTKDIRHAAWSIKIKSLPTKRRPLVQRRRLDHLARGSAAKDLNYGSYTIVSSNPYWLVGED